MIWLKSTLWQSFSKDKEGKKVITKGFRGDRSA